MQQLRIGRFLKPCEMTSITRKSLIGLYLQCYNEDKLVEPSNRQRAIDD